ncbi:hypothetical protein [Asticcacaulis sp. EMRT-3]|uniref:hypothetical protein n=1 Tax=Asticcacaulis sp. EMRT-3 TaxID=3040349 RepID=UPI0024AFC5F4|nr:hypothetical protein [Asticcacaulis sp. EMRT-3]MDI7776179.1 hypothetical protein [Asticcacaulis sp. EMRT-3]
MILVEDALQRARLAVKMPATLILLALWGQALIIFPGNVLPKPWPEISLLIGVLGWPLSVLYRAIASPRWKLWAYPQVGNPPHLREMAVAMKLIPQGNSLGEKIEICSPEDKRRILEYEGRQS